MFDKVKYFGLPINLYLESSMFKENLYYKFKFILSRYINL